MASAEPDSTARHGAEPFGSCVRRLRLAANLTQHGLAALVEVGAAHISKIEAGRERPSPALVRRLAETLAADPDELLLVARYMPDAVVDAAAADPAGFLDTVRRWQTPPPAAHTRPWRP